MGVQLSHLGSGPAMSYGPNLISFARVHSTFTRGRKFVEISMVINILNLILYINVPWIIMAISWAYKLMVSIHIPIPEARGHSGR
jgi:hypothetical protein